MGAAAGTGSGRSGADEACPRLVLGVSAWAGLRLPRAGHVSKLAALLPLHSGVFVSWQVPRELWRAGGESRQLRSFLQA